MIPVGMFGASVSWQMTFDEWLADTVYVAGARVTFIGVLYECLVTHTSELGVTPVGAPLLWSVVV